MKYLLQLSFIFITIRFFGQGIPVFGPEIPVTINGYTLDAMEPHISPDGNAMFFNSLNNGITTSLYYAAKSNDSTFNLVGLMPVVNETVTPYLNAVASLDSLNNFFWVSLRDYPSNFDNLHKVTFGASSAYNFARVHGNIYIYSPGWIIMDAAINHDGNYLYYCNAYFNNCGGLPCFAKLVIAQKVNDSTFAKLSNSNTILATVNDTSNYIIYAPVVTKDGLELYYTRAALGTFQTEVMVAVRSNTSSAFGTPSLIYTSPTLAPEGPTLTTDKQRLYYHKKVGSQYKLVLRYRVGTTGITESASDGEISLYPNPVKNTLNLTSTHSFDHFTVYDVFSNEVFSGKVESKHIEISDIPPGVYVLLLKDSSGRTSRHKFIKQ